jgi:hypothetical protein
MQFIQYQPSIYKENRNKTYQVKLVKIWQKQEDTLFLPLWEYIPLSEIYQCLHALASIPGHHMMLSAWQKLKMSAQKFIIWQESITSPVASGIAEKLESALSSTNH